MRRLLLALATTMWAIAACAQGDPAVPSTITGKVLEVLDTESFSYLRLQTKNGEIWAAVSRAAIAKGAEVTLRNVTMMKDFESKSLKRHFDRVAFGTIAGGEGGAAALHAGGGATGGGASPGGTAGAGGAAGAAASPGAAGAAASPGAAGATGGGSRAGAAGSAAPGATGAGLDMGAFHAGIAKSADVGEINVPKATGPNARTVAEIVTGKAELKDKTVEVRGKIVKYTAGVLGKNWIHLRDGTGAASNGTNDLVVTTKDDAKIGDVVLVKGVVHTDRDFGSGYSYPVLIEEAKLQK